MCNWHKVTLVIRRKQILRRQHRARLPVRQRPSDDGLLQRFHNRACRAAECDVAGLARGVAEQTLKHLTVACLQRLRVLRSEPPDLSPDCSDMQCCETGWADRSDTPPRAAIRPSNTGSGTSIYAPRCRRAGCLVAGGLPAGSARRNEHPRERGARSLGHCWC
jgi:hypothetical protein